jgi:3'-5' exonuclease
MTKLPETPAKAPLPASVVAAYDLETFLYFDIETIPDQRPGTLDKLREQVTAPASYKKQEGIDAWLAENRDSAAKEMLAKTSFDGGAGHVCTIGWAKNGGDIRVEHATDVGEEADVIRAFFADFDRYHSETLVGHNIFGFDIPFLLKRAIVLGLELPRSLPRDPKPWSNGIFDTMTAWAGAKDRISMNRLCGILGIVGKEDFDGSQVADAWANGEHERIAFYCNDDVERTRAIHQRFLAAGF